MWSQQIRSERNPFTIRILFVEIGSKVVFRRRLVISIYHKIIYNKYHKNDYFYSPGFQIHFHNQAEALPDLKPLAHLSVAPGGYIEWMFDIPLTGGLTPKRTSTCVKSTWRRECFIRSEGSRLEATKLLCEIQN